MNDDVQCIFSDDNANNLVLRVKVKEERDSDDDGDYISFLQTLEKELMSIAIRGIPNIDKVEISLNKCVEYLADGSYQQTDRWFLTTGLPITCFSAS